MIKKILLIDDDEDEQLIFNEALAETGNQVSLSCAKTAGEGIRLLQQLTPDYVFLDINMPILNGFECLSLIKKTDGINDIPVIIYSTGLNDHVCKKALQQGAADCIKKLSSINELAETLRKILKS